MNQAAAAEEQVLTPAELAARWKDAVKVETLANWRSSTNGGTPTGPAFLKLGSKVRYPLAAVLKYEQDQQRGGAAVTQEGQA